MSVDDLLGSQARTEKCRSCGAAIRWAHTANGRTMPIDAEPTPDGNVTYTGRPVTNDRGVTRPGVRVEGTAPLFDDGEPRYTSHFATCPHADDWRKS